MVVLLPVIFSSILSFITIVNNMPIDIFLLTKKVKVLSKFLFNLQNSLDFCEFYIYNNTHE